MRKENIPEYIISSTEAMVIILRDLGYAGDMTAGVLARANKFVEAAGTGESMAALEDDLDGWSVVVGFAAALGVVASCAGAWDLKKQSDKAGDLKKQRDKAGAN